MRPFVEQISMLCQFWQEAFVAKVNEDFNLKLTQSQMTDYLEDFWSAELPEVYDLPPEEKPIVKKKQPPKTPNENTCQALKKDGNRCTKPCSDVETDDKTLCKLHNRHKINAAKKTTDVKEEKIKKTKVEKTKVEKTKKTEATKEGSTKKKTKKTKKVVTKGKDEIEKIPEEAKDIVAKNEEVKDEDEDEIHVAKDEEDDFIDIEGNIYNLDTEEIIGKKNMKTNKKVFYVDQFNYTPPRGI